MTPTAVSVLAVDTAVSTTTPTPSQTPQPTSTATQTPTPSVTPITLPLDPMTPFPTVTPNYNDPEPKSIFLFYGDLGGDGNHSLWRHSPNLIIYSDGQTIVWEENGANPFMQTYLTPNEMCSLKQELEQTGFFKPPSDWNYYTEPQTSEGAQSIDIQLEATYYSFYEPNIQYLIDELKPGYDKIANYQPKGLFEPYIPNYLTIAIEEVEPDENMVIETWPKNIPPLRELLPEKNYGLIEGDLVSPIFNLFMGELTANYFQDDGIVYLVWHYPLLPHETKQNYTNYPERPIDYVPLLNCEDKPSFISPLLPTVTPTLTTPASKLTGKGRLLFVTDADGDREIYVMEADGTNRQRLTNNLSSDFSPQWSPDGQSILFVSDRDGDSEIFVMSSDGTNIQQLTHNEASDHSPKWSSDGSQIVFVSERDEGWEQPEIYMMNSDGSEQSRITNNDSRDSSPDWFNDHQIKFIQEVEYNKTYQLVTIDTTSLVEEKEVLMNNSALNPIQSPNKTVFATRYHANEDKWYDNWEIHILDDKFNLIEKLPIPITSPYSLNWSNDGQFIIFSAGNGDIFALDLTTKEVVQITFTEQVEMSPNLWP